MKVITLEPKKPGTARLEDIPEPDERDGSIAFPEVSRFIDLRQSRRTAQGVM